jgi:hypothetical protein
VRAYPAVLEGLLPALAVLTHADDDVEAVVTRIQALPVTLGAIVDKIERVRALGCDALLLLALRFRGAGHGSGWSGLLGCQ